MCLLRSILEENPMAKQVEGLKVEILHKLSSHEAWLDHCRPLLHVLDQLLHPNDELLLVSKNLLLLFPKKQTRFSIHT
jgi:hypothetical protein